MNLIFISRLSSVLVFFILAYTTASVCGEEALVTLLEIHDPGKALRYVWRIDIATVNDSAAWNGDGSPPLSVSAAVRIAKESLPSQSGHGPYQLFSVCLQRPARIDPRVRIAGPVVYFVTFRSTNPEYEQEPSVVAVLLNGTVLPPIIEPLQKGR
jgi:hypothetical protein